VTVIVTIAHARKASLSRTSNRLCAPGIYAWARRHGIDIGVFAREGVPVEVFDAIGDAFALRMAAIAREDQEATRGRE